MNVEERRDRILSLLQARVSIEIPELCKELDVSRETVRKDLYDLERDGLLVKVRGGAVLASGKAESAYDLRKSIEEQSKKAIARAARELIEPGDTVYLDYGTTTFMLARELMDVQGITVVTNALPIVNQLASNTGITLLVPGGVLRTNENSLYGPMTARNMEALFMNVGFFGCGGIATRAGFTNHNAFETAISRLAIEHSQKVVVLADHSKFGIVAENKTADFEQIDGLITDTQTPADTVAELRRAGVTVTTVTKG